jgi:hypothetical protein
MKATLKNSFLLLISSGVMWSSCVKQDLKALVNPGGPLQFNTSISNPTIVLLQANASSNLGSTPGTFFWNAADFGYKAAITYTIQFTRAGSNFATAATTELTIGSQLSRNITVRDFNAKMLDIIPFGVPSAIHARLKADVGSGVAPIYSNIITNIVVTAYLDIVNYTFPQAIYIAGNYQGWNPGAAPKIVDKSASGTTGSNYEGYINFTDGPPHEFKMVKGDNWGAGDFGSAGGNNLGNGGPNLQLGAQTAGVYLIRANTQNMTWSNYKIDTWGIIGDATPGGWGASTPMTFNPADGSWSITTNLSAGEVKFRANNDWAVNFGDDHNPPGVVRDNKPDYNGTNIPIAVTGNYTLVLNIGIAGNYNYTIRKN